MTGTPSRTARVPIVRWDLKEAAGKLLTRGTRSASEAWDDGRGSVGFRSPMSSGSVLRICDGCGRKVTRLTQGTLFLCHWLVASKGAAMGEQDSAEGDKDHRSDPRPERVNPDRSRDLEDEWRCSHGS